MFYVMIFSHVIKDESTLDRGKRILRVSVRLEKIAWGSLIVLLFTGVWNTIYNPISVMRTGHEVRNLAEFWMLWETAFGSAFMIKHVLFIVFVALMAYRSFRVLRVLRKAVEEMDALDIRDVEKTLEKVSQRILYLGYLILFFSAIVLFSLR